MSTFPDLTQVVKEYTDEQLLEWMKDELQKVKSLKKSALDVEWNTETYHDLTTGDLVFVKAKYDATRDSIITKAECTFNEKSLRVDLYIQHFLPKVLSRWVDVTDSFKLPTNGEKDLNDEMRTEINTHLLKLYDALAHSWKLEIKAMKDWLKKEKHK